MTPFIIDGRRSVSVANGCLQRRSRACAVAECVRRFANLPRISTWFCVSLALIVSGEFPSTRGESSGLRSVDCWQGDGYRAAECCGDDASSLVTDCFSHGRSRSSCCPPPGLSQRTCLLRASGVEGWSRLAAWVLDVPSSRSSVQTEWIEMLVLRPILVGWRQGYKGRTFRIIGSSGPLRPDLARQVRVAQSTALPLGLPLRPGDVVGWRHYFSEEVGAEGEVDLTDADGDDAPWCIGSKGCDDTGLCKFHARLPPGAPSWKVSIEAWPRSPPRSKSVYKVLKGLDLSGQVEANTTYEEFMTLRSELHDPSLHLFEDKIRLRRELLPSLGVEATPSILLTNSEPEKVLASIQGRSSYVVKPSHMSESQNVFVVRDGIDLLRRAWGQPDPVATPELIQATVGSFMQTTALDWECQALVSVPPGVVVEELVLSTLGGALSVDEYKFYTVWGEVVFGESVPFSSGAAMWIDREGNVFVSRSTCPPHCVAPCYKEMVQMAEKVAAGAKTDFLRVDILISGHCEGLYVSEVELYPASEFDPVLRDAISSRWRQGYGFPS
eukprot:TRINITY_DN30333_c0_g1_i1.p1 TRINITY_DN30333_c0_g1~~TRINITY_DN30333_c0_g1_i1.p1  ORF type:complete len:554 (-),score=56.55 TRINITY_DN30333_c0_g1_i1:88-1749(-)